MKYLATLPLNFGRKSPWDDIWEILYFINLKRKQIQGCSKDSLHKWNAQPLSLGWIINLKGFLETFIHTMS